jgi:hypothetical protein
MCFTIVKTTVQNTFVINKAGGVNMLNTFSCINCSKEIKCYTSDRKFCSVKCQNDKQYQEYIKLWKENSVDGMRGKTQTSKHIRRFLFEKYKESCSDCGWSETNPHTGTKPLEVEHIDGDYTNNKEENLKLICPNCHSLTSTWKGANKKQGRPRAKYYRGT